MDSPDPESLWPIGLFIPPINPLRFGSRRSDNGNNGKKWGEIQKRNASTYLN